jgi:single-strand DNA-binding protein
LTKGQRAYVEGRIRTRSWEGQDGQKHTRIEIIANRVIFLDKRQVDATSEAGTEEESDKAVEASDIPF